MINHKSTLPTVTILAFGWIWFTQTYTDAILTPLRIHRGQEIHANSIQTNHPIGGWRGSGLFSGFKPLKRGKHQALSLDLLKDLLFSLPFYPSHSAKVCQGLVQ
jgi:hypothetical protein